MKVVLDTNVIISGLLFPGGTPDRLVRAVLTNQLQNATSPDLLTELRTVLKRSFHLSTERVGELIELISDASELVYPTERLYVVKADPADNRVLECAVTGCVAFIVTGDQKHLGKLKTFGRIPIVTPAEFMRQVGL